MSAVDWKNGDNQITIFGVMSLTQGSPPPVLLNIDIGGWFAPWGLTTLHPALELNLSNTIEQKSKYTFWYDGKFLRIKPDYKGYSYVNAGVEQQRIHGELFITRLFYLSKGKVLDTWPFSITNNRLICLNGNLGKPVMMVNSNDINYTVTWCESTLGACNNNVQFQQWISLKNMIGCCTPGAKPDYCSIAGFSIDSPTSCSVIMHDVCQKDWIQGKSGSQPCQLYLESYGTYPAVGKAVQLTISNEINKRKPANYNSSRDGNDPFYTTAIPFLCSDKAQGACDGILYQYCAQFTTDDLQNDITKTGGTLRKLCGCHLSNGDCPINGNLNIKHCGCEDLIKPEIADSISKCTPLAKDQYNLPIQDNSCIPTCHLPKTIKSGSPAKICPATTCIIGNIDINNLNSQGGVYFTQICGGGKGNCYISDIDINKINSTGKITLDQKCGACYQFDPKTKIATPIDCGTLKPGSGKPPVPTPTPGPSGEPGLKGITGWFKKHRDIAIVGGVFFVILTIIIIYLIYGAPTSKTKYSTSSPEYKMDIPYGYNPYETC